MEKMPLVDAVIEPPQESYGLGSLAKFLLFMIVVVFVGIYARTRKNQGDFFGEKSTSIA